MNGRNSFKTNYYTSRLCVREDREIIEKILVLFQHNNFS